MPLTELLTANVEEARHNADVRGVYEMIAGQWVSSTVRAAAELGVIDAIAGGPRSADAIAEQTGCDAAAMRRLLVACTSLGLLTEDESGAFAPTSKGALLGDAAAGSLRALARLQGAPGVWQLWGALPDAVRQGESQATELLGEDYFSFLASNPDEGALFAAAMRDLTGVIATDAQKIIDFGSAREVLDVGGGNGSFLIGLLKANPDLHGSVLERPHEAQLAGKAAATSAAASRFEAIAGDFFDVVPAADYYILKLVLHDWSDAQCRQILDNCRASSRPGSRLLIVEALIGEADSDGSVLDLGAMMDMTILELVPGRERRLSEYDELLTATGWRREQLANTRSIYSLIEAVPA